MADPQSRIKRYQVRADECTRIADKLGDPLLRSQYMCVAEAYLKLVEIELDGLAGHPLRPDPSQH
jgi:hypothetical protein